MSSPQISAFFNVSGLDWDPQECTDATNLQATKVWNQPERLVSGGKRRSEWSVGFRRRDFDNVNDAIAEVLNLVWDRRTDLKEFADQRGYSLSVTCHVTIWKERPEFSLSAEVIRRLAWFGCEFLMDIFDYSDDSAVAKAD